MILPILPTRIFPREGEDGEGQKSNYFSLPYLPLPQGRWRIWGAL